MGTGRGCIKIGSMINLLETGKATLGGVNLIHVPY
jgi:hypothetical protein